ncbi:hypothetical protein PENSPDRAFT_336363 [Peniophora sp. CONT]|nr:hypothetical protein PENSPDRAFT_336363 [Peniophora sp. CONT]
MARIDEFPVELLKAVFLYIRYLPPKYEREPSCAAISQVCAHWRAVALGTPELWTLPPLKSVRWTELCLARSIPAPITIEAEWLRDAEYETRRTTLPLVYPELHRVLSLRTSSKAEVEMPTVLRELFEGLNSGPAPILSDLYISFDDADALRTGFTPFGPLDHPLDLPLAIFADARLVALRTASFKACMLPSLWSTTFLPLNLQSLTLVDSAAWINMDGMIEFFQLVPNLVFLDLQQPSSWRTCAFDETPSTVHPPRSVHLPHMRNLRINAPFWQGLALLIYLSLPVTASIDLNVCDIDRSIVWESPDTAEHLLRLGTFVVQQHFATMVGQGHNYIHVGLDDIRIMGPCPTDLANTLRVTHIGDLGPVQPYMHLSFGVGVGSAQHQHDSYALYLTQPMFTGAESMSVSTFPTSEAWPLFRHFTALRNLYLCEASFNDFAAAVAEAPAESRLFPALQRLQIIDTSIDTIDDELWDDEDMDEVTQRVQANIQRWLDLAQSLAHYEHFEMLILAGQIGVSEETFHAITGILGEQRVMLGFKRRRRDRLY